MFYYFAIIAALFTVVSLYGKRTVPPASRIGLIILAVGAVLCLYFAPYGTDRIQYELMFLNPGLWDGSKDGGWEYYNALMRFVTGESVNAFFFINDIIYVGAFLFFASRIFRREYAFYYFLIAVISLGFFSGGTNIMRSGMATAIFFVGLSRFPDKKFFVIFSLLAASIHFSITLTICSIVAGYYYPKVKVYGWIWGIALLLSIANVLGGFVDYFSGLMDSAGDRLRAYVDDDSSGQGLYAAGFRIDFLVYSVVPFAFAYYYKVKKHFEDKFYDTILSAYTLSNAFWLTVIRMPFTDRIALLSWILIPLLTAYPILTSKAKNIPTTTLILAILFPTALNIYFIL